MLLISLIIESVCNYQYNLQIFFIFIIAYVAVNAFSSLLLETYIN